MATRGSVVLYNSSFVGSSAGTSFQWPGGRTGVAVQALAYGGATGLQLQMQGPSGSWINVASSFLSDQVYVFDAVPSNYRIVEQASSSVGINAVMVPVPYNL